MDYRFNAGDTRLFVHYDRIEPGDVLLTRGAGMEAAAIAISTIGPYSHAALWLPFKRPGIPDLVPDSIVPARVESDDFGVGISRSNLSRATLKTGENIIVSPLQGVQTATLLRHPAMKTVDVERSLAAAESLQRSEFYLAYSLLGRLAVCAHPIFQRVARWVLAKEEIHDEWLINGTFCSELVAKYYSILELPLFDPIREPHTISPNDLGRSQLVEVEGAILRRSDFGAQSVTSRPVTNKPIGQGKAQPLDDGRAWVGSMVRFNSMNIIFAQKITEINNRANDAITKSRMALLSSHKAVMEDVREAINQALENQDHAALEKLYLYNDTATLVYCMSAELVRRAATQSPEQPQHLASVEGAAGDLTDELFRRVSYDFNRTRALMSLRQVRRVLRNLDGTGGRNSQLLDDRRRIFTLWLGLKRSRPVLLGFIDQLKQISAEGEGEPDQIQLREFIITALDNARAEWDNLERT